MAYIFKGRLCGLICAECPEALSDVIVRLYRHNERQDVTSLAVAQPKDTFAILTDEAVKAKASALIAETKTAADGSFTFELGGRDKYSGGAFEIDVYCGTVPHRKPGPPEPKPLQFTITTLQPMWRGSQEAGFAAAWEYCIPSRYWCAVRARFDAWTICGRVTTCDKQALPVAGVKVRAFDVDWWQDDELGSALTGSDGKFRIDYHTADFRVTPFSPTINVEWIGGPDLYFKIETAGGTALLTEPRTRGRAPDRQNAGHCFCVDLCVDVAVTPPYNNPWFTHVGDFHIYTDINPVSGRTQNAVLGHSGPGYGFFGGMKLRGFCPKTLPSDPSQPMRYRFVYETLAAPGVQIPITGDKVFMVLVGSRLIQWKLTSDTLVWTFQSIYIAGSGATPPVTPVPVGPGPWGSVPAHVITPDANGWVAVDQTGLDNGFYGPLIGFNSAAAIPGGAAPGNGAGHAVASPKNGTAIKIIFEAGPVSGLGMTFSNELPNVYINNWSEVRELNLTEFHAPGANSCSKMTDMIHIEYTTDHELMADWRLGISRTPAPVLPSGTAPRGGSGTEPIDISVWPSCSYTVTLSTRPALTNGEIDASGGSTSLTFCK